MCAKLLSEQNVFDLLIFILPTPGQLIIRQNYNFS